MLYSVDALLLRFCISLSQRLLRLYVPRQLIFCWISLILLMLDLKLYYVISQRRQWQATPVLLPGKSHGWRSLVGCSPWGRYELDATERLHFHALEKEMATHSSVLAWRIPGMAEPGGLLSMGSHRVGHDWSDLAAAAAACHIYSHAYCRCPTALFLTLCLSGVQYTGGVNWCL